MQQAREKRHMSRNEKAASAPTSNVSDPPPSSRLLPMSDPKAEVHPGVVKNETLSLMWNFSVVEGSLVVGRGGIKGQFTLDQVNTVTVQAVYQDAHCIRNVTIPAVPCFLVTAFEILNKNDVGVPDLGDKDEAFRKAGNLGRQKKLWEDTKKVVQEGSFDVSGALSMTDIGCLVKRFLRELKYPFVDVGSRIYTDLLAEMKQMTPILEFDAERYPLAGTLVFITINLNMMASRGSARMTIENLGILFAPSFVRSTNSKNNVDYSKDGPAVAVTKYLIEISPTTVFRSDKDFRCSSVPPRAARWNTGRSRSVVKRIFGFVRAKSHDRDEPVVRGLNRMATPLASNRVSGVPSDLPSSSRRSRSIIRRASYLSPYLNTPANKPPSVAFIETPLNRLSRLQEHKSAASRDYHHGGSDMKTSKGVMETKNMLEDPFEEEILSGMITASDVDGTSILVGIGNAYKNKESPRKSWQPVEINVTALGANNQNHSPMKYCTRLGEETVMHQNMNSPSKTGHHENVPMLQSPTSRQTGHHGRDQAKKPPMRPSDCLSANMRKMEQLEGRISLLGVADDGHVRFRLPKKPHPNTNRISMEDIVPPEQNHAYCGNTGRDHPHVRAHPVAAMTNLLAFESVVQTIGNHQVPLKSACAPAKKPAKQASFEPDRKFADIVRLADNAEQLQTVVFRHEGVNLTSRPSLVQLRKNQTVQKTRTVFENSRMLPNPLCKPNSHYCENDKENNKAGKLHPSAAGRRFSK